MNLLLLVKKIWRQNETTNNFKYLEDQLKKILEMLSKKDSTNKADNWLLEKNQLMVIVVLPMNYI